MPYGRGCVPVNRNNTEELIVLLAFAIIFLAAFDGLGFGFGNGGFFY